MKRDKALELVESKVKDDKLVKHMMAVEACMISLAEHFDRDKKKWGLAGILHDIDYQETQDNPEKHGLKGAEFLKDYDISEDILSAIRAHAGHSEPTNKLEISLLASDALSGLIVASALVHPEGLSQMNANFVLRRFNEKQFAKGANRENIEKCSKMGLELDEFVDICLSGMKKISNELGL